MKSPFPLSRLAVLEPERYQRVTKYAEPKEIGAYCTDTDGKYHFDRTELGVYREPKLPCDLNDGYPKRYRKSAPGPVGLGVIVKCMERASRPVNPAFCTCIAM